MVIYYKIDQNSILQQTEQTNRQQNHSINQYQQIEHIELHNIVQRQTIIHTTHRERRKRKESSKYISKFVWTTSTTNTWIDTTSQRATIMRQRKYATLYTSRPTSRHLEHLTYASTSYTRWHNTRRNTHSHTLYQNTRHIEVCYTTSLTIAKSSNLQHNGPKPYFNLWDPYLSPIRTTTKH